MPDGRAREPMTVRVTESTPVFRSRVPWWAKSRVRKDRTAAPPAPAGGAETAPSVRD
ncbi:hypothetical protein ATK36_2462 [Amycolatopsis sulphurea]|uniref:Uncharacterized protein n=1 Tax=Amycolatopsis sulphurea TaxID=76022 RepID=A0A2A9FAG6_9PSEU|nr:hypothetical protein ATK36_2462 [Amycolatopsis sulphurea]